MIVLYLDTSVIVNSFFVDEEDSEFSLKLMEDISNGVCLGVTSEYTLLEVACAISRVTSDPDSAKDFVRELREYPNFSIQPFSPVVLGKAFEVAYDCRLRSGDAIQVASALLEEIDYFVFKDVDFDRARDNLTLKTPKQIIEVLEGENQEKP